MISAISVQELEQMLRNNTKSVAHEIVGILIEVKGG